MTEDLLIERDMVPSDVDFILASWLRSYRLSPLVQEIAKDIYFREQNRIANRLLVASDVTLLVSAEDPDTIIAWISSKNHWIHYLYVKHQFRRMGLAKRLVGDPAKWKGYTHRTLLSAKLRLPARWNYDPFQQWNPSMGPRSL